MEKCIDKENVSGKPRTLGKYEDVHLSAGIDDADDETDQVDLFERKENDGIPKDRGWAWFVLLGATLEMILQLGMIKSAGILFVAFQEKFDSSSSVTSLLSTVQNICQSFMSFLVMTCGIKLTTYRNLMFFGSTIICVAYIITSQATDVRVLLFSHGVLQGIGVGMTLPTTVTMVSLYFEKRRGLANSLAVSGGPVGGVIFASLITKLLPSYGYQGCVLILAGILLNGCVSGALFRPASFYTEKMYRRRIEKDAESQELFPSSNKINDKYKYPDIETIDPAERNDMDLQAQISISASVNLELIKKLNKTSEDKSKEECKGQKKRSYSFDDIHQKQRSEVLCSRMKHSYPGIEVSVEDIRQTSFDRNEREKTANRPVGGVKMILYNLSESCNYKLLTNPLFLAIMLQGSFVSSGTVVAPTFSVPYAKDMNVSAEDLATLVTTQSCVDFFSRIIIGYISDKGWLRRSTIVGIASIIVSVSSCLLRLYTSYNLLLGYSIVLGLVSGVYFALYTVVLIDYLSLANFQTCLGFMSLVHGFSVAGGFYLVGYLRDITGSYVVPHLVTGVATGVGALIMFSLPLLQRLHKKSRHGMN
ncbi:monocarboxylate transporter 12-B-like [Mercenaria mercenaria]|uniref:monocarboxylate transporter 12-B-like n=1 Tax=Mercenaria mercenaria TaxID=6596 RepID=UPI00234F06AA|nr:monocarboxylate transporter 12-B-like [Mercenaria mercenaria]